MQASLRKISLPITPQKQDADHIFYELTRSICPECRRIIDGHVLLRNNKVYMRKRCPEHGEFEGLIYGDAQAYTSHTKFNKPGTIPLQFSTEIAMGCPHDCGLCPDHQQHSCVGIIEVNTACDMDCPLCFADAGHGYSLTIAEVEDILDHFVATEGDPEVVQFSGGEPSIHPDIIPMLRAAKERNIANVMLNTNGKRIANDDAFLAELAELKPFIYFQFDGFERETYRIIRGEPEILPEKIRALDRLAEIGCMTILVPAIERGVNEHEIGDIIKFGLEHPAVYGINFQPAFHAGRHMPHDPLQRITIPDLLKAVEAQTDGLFLESDFTPVPCCFPTCNSATYAYIDQDGTVLPLSRLVNVDNYLDYFTNRVLPDLKMNLRPALEMLWSSSAAPGMEKATRNFVLTCAACGIIGGGIDLGEIAQHMFMIMFQDFMDLYTFNQKNLMKCCKEILLPDGYQIPFCAYNTVGYREQARGQLAARQRARIRAGREGAPFTPRPLRFEFGQPYPHLKNINAKS